MNDPTVYIGKDLEAMSFAVNYHRWILDELKPFIGDHVVEVGAGIGSFTELLLELEPQSLALVEPSEMFYSLEVNTAERESKTDLSLYHSVFTEAAGAIVAKQRPDTIIYVNVLEHIEDDENELKAVFDTLADGGHCLIFVPALMSLYGEFDRKVGHFRRYSKRELEEKCRAAGFNIVRSFFFDIAGVLPWYMKYRVLNSDGLGSQAVTAYDNLVVPIMRRIEQITGVPVVKNLLAIMRKA